MLRVTQKHQAPKTLPRQTNVVSFPLPCWKVQGGAWRGQTFSMAQQCWAMLGTSFSAVQHHSTAVWEAALNMALGAHARGSVRQLKEMQTDPPRKERKTLPSFFQLYPGPRSATSSLLLCSILSHKTQRERECDKDESDVAGSYVKTITLQLSVIDFPNQRCIQLPTDRYGRRPDAGEFSTRAWSRTSQGNKMEML